MINEREDRNAHFVFQPGASSMAPHIALHEVGAPFEGKPVSLAKKETHTPEFLAINPEGKVRRC